MTILASNGLVALLPLLFFIACPLVMIFMMRGMHGGGHGHAGHGAHSGSGHHATNDAGESKPSRTFMSLDELKRERDELNALIMDRAEQEVARR